MSDPDSVSSPDAGDLDTSNSEIAYSTMSGSDSNSVSDSDAEELRRHLRYLRRSAEDDNLKEAALSPIFTASVRRYAKSLEASTSTTAAPPLFPQHSLLGCEIDERGGGGPERDTRVFYNVAAPCSIFICGSQGSGKSHTLSCVLEGCLIPSEVSNLRRPLAGLVFHYDTFISESGGAPCEVAYLASHPDVDVRVLCAPTNLKVIEATYKHIPNVTVETLRIKETDLNTKRMLDLMAVGEGSLPLYLHVVQRILREMRIEQQQASPTQTFSYARFKRRIEDQDLTSHQTVPLYQRLETLESFMVQRAPSRSRLPAAAGTEWDPRPGQLTIVDLSCPCVTAEMACSLFNICLSVFLEQGRPARRGPSTPGTPAPVGRIVALDEAHKYMTADDSGSAAATLTGNLLSTIRLQRHLGLRVVISTQEPTVSPKLLDLCSVTVVHRFTSPAWMKALRDHLAGGSDARANAVLNNGSTKEDPVEDHFSSIVRLRVGEALMFAPSAAVSLEPAAAVKKEETGEVGSSGAVGFRRLGHEMLKIRVRSRMTTDGGATVMAT